MKSGIKLEGKRVLVVGLARTGVASALFCAGRGAHVTATDEKPEAELATAVDDLRAAGVTLELGGHRKETFLAQDIIIQSPGVAAEMECFVAARDAGVAVWSELELAWRFLRGQLIGITGSNGKTTTTSLVGHILSNAGLPTLVGGNIGTPLISLVDLSVETSRTVAEMSSFQLETIDKMRPDIAVWLNLTPDHLDRHASLQLYGQAKARIFENQTENDAAILNADDPETPRYAPSGPRVHWFSRERRVMTGAFVRENEIVFRQDGEQTVLLRRGDIGLRGEHNVENVLAAAAAAFLAGAPPSAIAEGVRTFAGVEHRLEFVAKISGVEYFNDSKATNVDATLKAIDAFAGNLLIILGGKDKGSDFTALREPLHRRARVALTIGKAAEKISAQIAGAVAVEAAGTLERAVHMAHEMARPGDVVLLAPACASFDQFDNYEHRGRVFKQAVRGLMAEGEKKAS
ncbi:MAG: UDP-N-acetylmuramoyl-L-alanine--D-glutamate ligase [Acidobacteria bacterium]|nr:UDP-N-acetylmuramoyl-L-alanine--D-glutamate ligase [Acidobacteriota bacterium]